MIFQREAASTLWPEILPLLALHAHELSHFPDIPMDVDKNAYEVADEQDVLRCYTARLDGVLVGYGVFFIRQHPHYKGSRQSVQDVFFIVPEHRRGGLGSEFLTWCDEQLKADRSEINAHHVKAAHPELGKLLERMGYEVMDVVYTKRLD